MRVFLPALAVLLCSVSSAAAGTVGFERGTVPDSDGKPRDIGIWYPSDAAAASEPIGLHRQTVAMNGGPARRQLPLVVLLHGDRSSFANHYGTALALAEAGFVVTGVNQDMSLPERPRHVRRVLDYMLAEWPHRDRLDSSRIGVFGFSVGGFTALVALGGAPDFARIAPHCAERSDRICEVIKQRNIDTSIPVSAWVHDERIKAAVLAAPTLGFTFPAAGVAAITAPIQLWRAGRDEITAHPWNAEAIYQALPSKPEYVVVSDAGHFAFVSCSAELAARAPVMCRDSAGFDRAGFQRTFNLAVVSFFKAKLAVP